MNVDHQISSHGCYRTMFDISCGFFGRNAPTTVHSRCYRLSLHPAPGLQTDRLPQAAQKSRQTDGLVARKQVGHLPPAVWQINRLRRTLLLAAAWRPVHFRTLLIKHVFPPAGCHCCCSVVVFESTGVSIRAGIAGVPPSRQRAGFQGPAASQRCKPVSLHHPTLVRRRLITLISEVWP